MSGIAPFPWRHVLLCGVLWAVGVTLAEAPSLPLQGLFAGEFVRVSMQMGLLWVGSGLAWATGAKLAEERRRGIVLPLTLVIAWSLGMIGNIVWQAFIPPEGDGTMALLTAIPLGDLAAYLLWSNLFYGTLYCIGYLVARRAGCLRAALAEQRRACSEADGALREAHLASLRGQLQPDLLIEALAALRRRYAVDPAQAEELFDRLIGFLRAAMPGVRSGRSTVRAELDVLVAYAKLRAVLPMAETLRLGEIAPPPVSTYLPPLLLLPAIDAIGRAVPRGSTITIAAAPVGDHFRILIDAGAPIDEDRLAGFGDALAAAQVQTVVLPNGIELSLPLCTSSYRRELSPTPVSA